MSTFEIVLVALALSMDAFAVTISNMFAYRGSDRLHRALMPILFGLFQGGMTLIGFFAGSLVGAFVERYAGIVAFVILGCIGAKMLWDAFHESDEETPGSRSRLTVPILLVQAVATSIDALAVGVSVAALSLDIVFTASVIGVTTAFCCVVALFIGQRFGMKLGNKATMIGGVVLIVIGIKSLFT